MTDEQSEILQRVDSAIARLSALEQTTAIAQSIENLQTKRQYVVENRYVLRQINEEACRVIGAEIARMTKAYAGCKNLLKRSARQEQRS